jgi:hypothetical protein
MNPKLVSALLALGLFTSPALAQPSSRIMGFSAESAERELAAERIMASIPDTAKMREYHYALTRRPHHAGTEARRRW